MSGRDLDRELLRLLVDRARRAAIDSEGSVVCAECGAELDCWTAGCTQCGERHRRRARRGDYPGGWEAYERRRAEAFETQASFSYRRRAATRARSERSRA